MAWPKEIFDFHTKKKILAGVEKKVILIRFQSFSRSNLSARNLAPLWDLEPIL
jgi:hypothetical protein